MPSFNILHALLSLPKVLSAAIPPKLASVIAAYLIGQPHLATELNEICRRESRCSPVSIHHGDSKFAELMTAKATRVGWLSPETCLFHRMSPVEYGTRGAYGTAAAYTLHHLGGCLPPQILDIPLFAAIAAGKRMIYQCKRHNACTSKARHQLWAGKRKRIK